MEKHAEPKLIGADFFEHQGTGSEKRNGTSHEYRLRAARLNRREPMQQAKRPGCDPGVSRCA
ncbi:hypothetical protein [Leptothrix cholodnii]|uniref:hypothetical protein n=1 Tax=Leptothrix cholodnii TaxID=34029 RepID=UPI00167F369C|nr:hypothetical protein [Leptothrix cholodnii]